MKDKKIKVINKTSDKFVAKKYTRSIGGNLLVWFFLALFGSFLALPLIYVIASSLKPYNEIFIFPPKILVNNPTIDNFIDFLRL